MKKLILLLAVMLVVFSCSKDTIDTETTADLVMQQNIDLNAKEQSPLASFDNENKGIYLGVYVSGSSTERGLIWVNIGNNGDYNAIVEMTTGETLRFQGTSTSKGAFNYHFVAKNAQFDVVLEDNVPVIKNASLNNELFFGVIVKDKSNTRAMAETGVYLSDNGLVGGTWNLITDGTIVNPNGFPGEGLTSVVVTRNAHVFMDTTFETFDFVCTGITAFIPMIADFDASNPNSPASWGQTSNFNGTTTWGIILNGDGGINYLDGDCNAIPAGRFTYNGTLSGDIFIDVLP